MYSCITKAQNLKKVAAAGKKRIFLNKSFLSFLIFLDINLHVSWQEELQCIEMGILLGKLSVAIEMQLQLQTVVISQEEGPVMIIRP